MREPAAGLPTLVLLLGGLAACVVAFVGGVASQEPVLVGLAVICGIVVMFLLSRDVHRQPERGEGARAVRPATPAASASPGMYWANPFFRRTSISLRIHNFESAKLKVNDHDGNPIEIAAIVVWRVVDSAEATFEVEDYRDYVRVQSESAVRNLATLHPYDAHQEGQLSLRGSTAEMAEQLKAEIQERVSKAGVEVSEARISHLAYSPEIAAAMLRRQQASAIIAARQKIVEGAVSMVEMALHQLTERKIVEMDEERKATMVSNLMVVLCSEHNAQPVLNMGAATK